MLILAENVVRLARNDVGQIKWRRLAQDKVGLAKNNLSGQTA